MDFIRDLCAFAVVASWNCFDRMNWWPSSLEMKIMIGMHSNKMPNTKKATNPVIKRLVHPLNFAPCRSIAFWNFHFHFRFDGSGKYSMSYRWLIKRSFFFSWLEVIEFRSKEWKQSKYEWPGCEMKENFTLFFFFFIFRFSFNRQLTINFCQLRTHVSISWTCRATEQKRN